MLDGCYLRYVGVSVVWDPYIVHPHVQAIKTRKMKHFDSTTVGTKLVRTV